MKRAAQIILTVLVVLIGSNDRVRAQDVHQPYLPLARVVITASGGDVDTLLQSLSGFAAARKFTVGGAPFPKQGRTVVNVEIHLGQDSFFLISNFINPEKFDLIAYSHEDESAWRVSWDELIGEISTKLGKDKVSKVQ